MPVSHATPTSGVVLSTACAAADEDTAATTSRTSPEARPAMSRHFGALTCTYLLVMASPWSV